MVGSSFTPRALGSILLGAVAIAVGAWISVPFEPVPMTLQTLAVLIAGAIAGRLGVAAVIVYLLLASIGLPVLAGFARAPGFELLTARSSGYLFGFVPGVLLAARIATANAWWKGFVWAVLAHAVILACGVGRLAFAIGTDAAFEHGLWPFLPGALSKSALAVLVVAFLRRRQVDG